MPWDFMSRLSPGLWQRRCRLNRDAPHVGRHRAHHWHAPLLCHATIRPSRGFCEHLSRAPHMCNRSEEHTSELQSLRHLVCRLLLENDTATTEIYTLSLHDALPIYAPLLCHATIRPSRGFCEHLSRAPHMCN